MQPSIGEFTLTLNSQNTGRGNVVYRVSLDRLEDVPQGVTVTMATPRALDATLQVSPTPTTTSSPTPTPTANVCSATAAYQCTVDGGCWQGATCACDYSCTSPVIIDIQGDGFSLTDAKNGVDFDLDGDGYRERYSWTAANSEDAFLFLDRNENGIVDNGAELFGNFTVQQPPPPDTSLNGFNALATYDRPGYFGGNGDGMIDRQDEVFSQLRLWRDANHNGISEPRELSTLPQSGIEAISLDYKESGHTDRYGNSFRYRAKVYGANRRDLGRWAYDVFLKSVP